MFIAKLPSRLCTLSFAPAACIYGKNVHNMQERITIRSKGLNWGDKIVSNLGRVEVQGQRE